MPPVGDAVNGRAGRGQAGRPAAARPRAGQAAAGRARSNAALSRRGLLRAAGLGGLGLAGTALLAACGVSGEEAQEGEGSVGNVDLLTQIQSNGVVRIGMEGTFRPYGYHDASGELVGFEKEIGDLVAADLGVRAEYIETQWDSLIAGVDVGRYDLVINNVAATEERRQSFDFSIPYALSQGRVAVAEDSPLRSVEEIAGHSAGQTETSNFAQMMAQAGAKIVPVTGFDEAIMLVSYDRIEATANDEVTFQAFFDERPDVPIRLLEGTLGEPAASAILMPKGQDHLAAAINDSLRRRMDDGALAAIYEKYVGQDLTPPASYR